MSGAGDIYAARSREENYQRYLGAKARLTPEQIERIKAKCQWEHMSWLGVFEQWPSLFSQAAAPPEEETA